MQFFEGGPFPQRGKRWIVHEDHRTQPTVAFDNDYVTVFIFQPTKKIEWAQPVVYDVLCEVEDAFLGNKVLDDLPSTHARLVARVCLGPTPGQKGFPI
jgi:hypothetical protein